MTFLPVRPRVAVRPANDEPPRRVDQDAGVLVQQVSRHHRVDDVLSHVLRDLLVGNVVGVLRADHDGVDALGLPVRVLHRHLRFAVRFEVRNDALPPGNREAPGELVR